MKDYIKPTFILAGLAPVALAAMNCRVKLKGEYLESLYVSLDIPVEDYDKAFLMSEGCDAGVPDGMTEFCKFTATPEASGLALTS